MLFFSAHSIVITMVVSLGAAAFDAFAPIFVQSLGRMKKKMQKKCFEKKKKKNLVQNFISVHIYMD